jgi:hypothetical protein
MKVDNTLVRTVKLALLQKSTERAKQPAAALIDGTIILVGSNTDHAGQNLHGISRSKKPSFNRTTCGTAPCRGPGK